MQASVYFFVEVNQRPERRSLSKILPQWEIVRSRHGRNDVYSDPTVHRLIGSQEIELGTKTRQQRYVTIARYEHRASGVVWTGATTHLSSSVGTTSELAEASRELQGRRLAELCAEFDVDVMAGDLNNIAVRDDTPRGILEAAGYVDWRAATTVENVEYTVHHSIGQPVPRTGKHLDAIYLGARATALDGRVQITEPDSSDHLGLVCTVSISR
jgi:endonuclease/exonuclease/phosphatase family metal-dependent hydrolase